VRILGEVCLQKNLHCFLELTQFTNAHYLPAVSAERRAGHAQENGRSQSALDKREWNGPCNERLVSQLLQDLKGWGMDLESFHPKDLFETIRGRTLWLVLRPIPAACRLQPPARKHPAPTFRA
jgi:hypothetical protein